jgi:hypothetical protein
MGNGLCVLTNYQLLLPIDTRRVDFYPPKMRQGGGRYNRGRYIEPFGEYRRWFSVWGIAASK